MVARVRFLLLSVAVLAAPFQSVRAENLEHVKQVRETGKCPTCDLSSANLSGLVSPEADLRNADLTGANLTGADLSGANLSGSIGARLGKATTDVTTTCPDGANGPCAVK